MPQALPNVYLKPILIIVCVLYYHYNLHHLNGQNVTVNYLKLGALFDASNNPPPVPILIVYFEVRQRSAIRLG